MRRAGLTLGVLVVFLGAAAPAHALDPVPPTVQRNAGQVTEWLYRGGGTQNVPGCGGTCDDLWLSEHRPMPDQAASKKLHGEIRRLRFKAGLTKSFGALGRLSLQVTAFQVGWTIGTGIREQFLEGGTVPAADQEVGSLFPVEQGDIMLSYSLGGGEYQRVRAPTEGYVAESPQMTQVIVRESEGGCDSGGGPPAPRAGYQWASTDWRACFFGGPGRERSHVLWRPTTIPPPVPYSGQRPIQQRLGDVADPGAPAARDTMLDEFQNRPGDYPTLRPWLDHELGGTSSDPTVNEATVPNPLPAEIATDYARRVRELGFTNVRTYVVPPEQARLDLPAGAVVGVDPAGGSRVATETEVKIAANPDESGMPVLVPAPEDGETAAAYLARLQRLGLVGRVTRVADPNLDYGPDAVLRVAPAPSTRVQKGTEVDVRANPTNAPAPSAGASPGGCGLVAPRSRFDWSPVTRARMGDKVPFALVGWIGSATSGLAVDGRRPNATFSAFGESQDLGWLANFDGLVGVLRLVLIFLLWIGVAWFLYGRTIGRDT